MLRKRIKTFCLVAVLGSACVLPADDDPYRISFWAGSEIESAHVSRGKIRCLDPVMNLDLGVKQNLGSFGYAALGLWSEGDLCARNRATRSPYFAEQDPIVLYGYLWKIADGWSLDSSAGIQWNVMAWYKGDGRHSYDEWQGRETLVTPWFTTYFVSRTFFLPYYAFSFKWGVRRSFPIWRGLSFEPNLFCDGGSERHNRRRFGLHGDNPDHYRGGANSATLQLYLAYRFTPQVRLYGGISQYVVVDPDLRSQVRDDPSTYARNDLLFATVGLDCRF